MSGSNGTEGANEGFEAAVEKGKEFAADATENVKEFFSGDVGQHAKDLAEDVTENVKEFGSKIAGIFKGGRPE